jgi:hypothetical protein
MQLGLCIIGGRRGLHGLKLEKSTEISCENCAFFGKPFLCVRKEKNPKAITCLSYKTKISLQDKALYPLLPDVGLGKIKEEDVEVSGASILWFLVPLFFGIIGGIVAYIGVKDDDEEMATNLLIFGIVWTLILFAIGYYIFVVMFSWH